jgi:aldehyde dehydrogenase (NAD+)
VSKPIGVAALITLWTFLVAIPACKLAPALSSGNAVVLDRAARGRAAQQLT